ncbi:MAG TPA: helix-turn-helix domain-containing protein [Sphingomicrobium sp.]|nr:helix-turn-helix domain-containing protein [Sphingomicrobium sp.]
MPALAVNLEDYHEPSQEEITAAREAARRLSKVGGAPVSFVVESREAAEEAKEAAEEKPRKGRVEPEPITLPLNIFKTIIKLLAEMGNGNAVQVVPVQAELTTQQAADLLNVSRPHLIKLLEQEKIPFRKVGTHRKVLARDLFAYRDRTDLARREGLSRMVADDEEIGLYDDEPLGVSD